MEPRILPVAAALALLLSTTTVFASATVDFYSQLPDELRLLYVIGYVEGFAVAAEAGPLGPKLQECFANWSNAETKTTLDLWMSANPDKRGWTLRVALYAAIAETCGWKRR